MKHRIRTTRLAAAALAVGSLTSACLGSDTDLDLGESTGEVIGGVPAFSRKLNAIGSIQKLRESGIFDETCTGTLITPTMVVTAEHCIVGLTPDQLRFAIGPSDFAPERIVTLRGMAAEQTIEGGVLGLGSDVAVLHLNEAVTDFELPIVAPFDPGLIGQRFTAVGYGVQNNDGDFGTRLAGSLTLRSGAGGNPLAALFGTVEGFLASGDDIVDFPPDDEIRRQAFAEEAMVDSYEAVFGGVAGDAQICFGDSGGPIIKRIDGKLYTFGVASWGYNSATQTCGPAAIYGLFGPAARAFLEREAACPLIPAAGLCEGDVAVRCTQPNEGKLRTVRNDCSELAQVCGIDATTRTVGCVDPADAP
jgi:secreted trypsin-like serine protease